jgi:hypothetical protein
MTLPKLHFKIFMLLGSFIPLLTQCLPDGPNYLVDSYEGMITVTTDSASSTAFNTLTIHRSKSYTNYLSLNDVNYEFISNGNHLIVDDTLQKEVNGFLYADGDLYIDGDSLSMELHVSQFTADTTLYFLTVHQGTLVQIR